MSVQTEYTIREMREYVKELQQFSSRNLDELSAELDDLIAQGESHRYYAELGRHNVLVHLIETIDRRTNHVYDVATD